MIQALLRAAGIGPTFKPVVQSTDVLTPDAQLRRFAEVCARLEMEDESPDDLDAIGPSAEEGRAS